MAPTLEKPGKRLSGLDEGTNVGFNLPAMVGFEWLEPPQPKLKKEDTEPKRNFLSKDKMKEST